MNSVGNTIDHSHISGNADIMNQQESRTARAVFRALDVIANHLSGIAVGQRRRDSFSRIASHLIERYHKEHGGVPFSWYDLAFTSMRRWTNWRRLFEELLLVKREMGYFVPF